MNGDQKYAIEPNYVLSILLDSQPAVWNVHILVRTLWKVLKITIHNIDSTYEMTHTCKSSVSFTTLLLTSLDAILEILYNQMKLD